MPLTLFAHQVPAIGMKFARPRWFDGTALCIGSMAPDLGYAVSSYLHVDTHGWSGFLLPDTLIALVFTLALRWWAVDAAAGHLPDLGTFRLWSWRVLLRRAPAWWVTVTSALLGVLTHIGLDSFTHPGRPGVRLLGYQHVSVHLLGRTEPLASVLQVIGHTAGSLVGAWLLWHIGRRRTLEQWYGASAVAAVRTFAIATSGRMLFWSIVAAGIGVGLWWGRDIPTMVGRIERPLFAGALAMMVAAAIPLCRPRPVPADYGAPERDRVSGSRW